MEGDKAPAVGLAALILWAAGLAAFTQMGVLLMLPAKYRPPWLQVLGALMFSSVLGGLVVVVAQEVWHWAPFLAGAAGVASGMLPAAVSSIALTRLALKRAGLNPEDISSMERVIRGAVNGGDGDGSKSA